MGHYLVLPWKRGNTIVQFSVPDAVCLLIGGSQSEDAGGDSDDLYSWAYFNRAKEVYKLLGVPERFQFCSTSNGHKATGEQNDRVWQSFLQYFLVAHSIKFEGYR
jgi:hypothetical protein